MKKLTWRSFLYAVLRSANDYRAIRKGKVPRRVARRALGKLTGQMIRRMFR